MANVAGSTRRLFSRPEGLMIAVLVAAAVALVSAAVIGGRQAEVLAAPADDGVTAPGGEEIDDLEEVPDSGELVDGPAVKPGSRSDVPGTDEPGAPGTTSPGKPKQNVQLPSATGATREGVFPEHFEFGLHGPLTLDGVPLNLAEDPVTGIKGYLTYINRNGGINGRKVQTHIIDDRYTTQGGQQAADKL